jgi:NAD(P)-dependent dehydrogenase (short-subunit alcohol dehydrogenase family)
MRLAGKVAIVTGGASGIGRGIADCLAREGADVAIADLQLDKATEVASQIEALGRNAMAVRTDVTHEQDFAALFDQVHEALGKIDILVNNAGVFCKTGLPFMNNVAADWDLVWDVNVKSIFFACKAIAPHFIERRSGRIINIASIAGPLNTVSMPPYSVSKMGAITLTKIVAKDLASYGVTVNAICPGMLWTPFWHEYGKILGRARPELAGLTARQVFENRVEAITPLKREQTPEDIGWAAVFLASDHARNITGQALMVDGGIVM